MIWFTSDTHFSHQKVCDYRPFEHMSEMNDYIIDKWNEVVSPQDTVFHLGDACFANNEKEINKILFALKGNKVLIKGNHDRKRIINHKCWGTVKDYHELNIRIDVKNQLICLHVILQCL